AERLTRIRCAEIDVSPHRTSVAEELDVVPGGEPTHRMRGHVDPRRAGLPADLVHGLRNRVGRFGDGRRARRRTGKGRYRRKNHGVRRKSPLVQSLAQLLEDPMVGIESTDHQYGIRGRGAGLGERGRSGRGTEAQAYEYQADSN